MGDQKKVDNVSHSMVKDDTMVQNLVKSMEGCDSSSEVYCGFGIMYIKLVLYQIKCPGLEILGIIVIRD